MTDQKKVSAPGLDRKEGEPSRRLGWLSRINWPAVTATVLALGIIYSLFEKFDTLTNQIHTSEKEIRSDIGEKLEKQTNAIQKNTQGLAVLEERVDSLKKEVEKDVGQLGTKIDSLKDDVEKDVKQLGDKIDDLTEKQSARY